MNTTAIRQKLCEYINVADEKKIKAIYSIIKNDLNEADDWWNDQDFITTLDRISNDLKNGTDKGYQWTEIKNGLLKKSN